MFIKKFSKMIVGCIILVSMVFALCSCSPEAKFEKAQKKEINNCLDSVLDAYGSYSGEQTVNSTMKVTLGSKLLAMLKSNTDVSFDWVNDVSIDLETAMNGSGILANVDLSYGNKEFASAAAILDLVNGNVYALIPQLTEKYLGLSMVLPSDLAKNSDELPAEKDLRKVIDKYIDIAFDNLPEAESEKGALDINGVSQSCKIYTIKFTQIDLLNMGEVLLETAKNDKDLKKLFIEFCEFGASDADVSPEEIYNEWIEEINDVLDGIESEKSKADSSVCATWTSYIDDEVIGTKIEAPDMELEFFCGTAQKKDDVRFKCYLTAYDYEPFRAEGDLTEKKNKLSGELKVYSDEEIICFVGVENFDRKAWEDGYLNGTFSVSPSKNTMQWIESIVGQDYATLVSTCSLKFDVTSSKNNSDITVSFMSGEELYFALRFDSETKDSATINIPKDSQTIKDDPEKWMEDVDWDKAIADLKSSGLPQDIVDLILNYIESVR